MERKGLGRGLSALLADVATVEEAPRAGAAPAPRAAGSPNLVPIERIRANPDQPRRDFDEKELQDLAASIREKGVIQPLILRPHPVRGGAVRDRRRRAALARGADRRACTSCRRSCASSATPKCSSSRSSRTSSART